MKTIPKERTIDGTLKLLSEGYEYITRRCLRLGTDVFETRLLLRPTICMRGEEAARLFYDTERFRRSGSAPMRVQKTLFGRGGVQGLDDEAHRHRKRMFMSLMTDESIARLAALTEKRWDDAVRMWETQDRIELFDGMHGILLRAVCEWAGVPLEESEVERRKDDVAGMIDAAGSAGPRYVRGRIGRKRSNRWIEEIIRKARDGRIPAPEGSALGLVSTWRDPDGRALDGHTAAVELLNLLRPTVAVARFVVFGALALHDHPECREPIRGGDEEYLERFVQEVRRYYPFFPFVAARVRRDFDWNGFRFPADRRVLLDLYGTDHDERLWDRPNRVPARTVPRVERQRLQFHPPGRRRPLHESPLSRRVDHHHPHEDGDAPTDAHDNLHRTGAGSRRQPVEGPGNPGEPVRHRRRQTRRVGRSTGRHAPVRSARRKVFWLFSIFSRILGKCLRSETASGISSEGKISTPDRL